MDIWNFLVHYVKDVNLNEKEWNRKKRKGKSWNENIIIWRGAKIEEIRIRCYHWAFSIGSILKSTSGFKPDRGYKYR